MNQDPNQPQAAPVPASAPLQFEKAEFAAEPALICAACKTPIADQYYQMNGKTVCPICKERIERTGGTDPARVGLAVLFGALAGVGGFILYFVVTLLIRANLSLLAVVTGWLVGTAVRKASQNRGGRIFQIVAVAITYVAVCAIYLDSFEGLWRSLARAMIAPWQEGASNIIGWLIIAFALYEAWMLNRPVALEVSGPFFARQSRPPAAT